MVLLVILADEEVKVVVVVDDVEDDELAGTELAGIGGDVGDEEDVEEAGEGVVPHPHKQSPGWG